MKTRTTNDILEDILMIDTKMCKLIEAWMSQDKHYHKKTLKRMGV